MPRLPRFSLLQVLLLIALPAIFLGALAEINRRWRHLYYDASVAISPDGRTMASGISDLPVLLWDGQSLEQLAVLRGHAGYVSGVAFSPDGRLLASCATDDTVHLWDVGSRRPMRQFKAGQDGVTGIRFSPDGNTLATGGHDASVKLWDVATGQQQAVLSGHGRVVKKLAFSPDGALLAAVGQYGNARLWDVDSGQCLMTLNPPSGTIEDVAFSPEGTLATATRNKAQVWDIQSGTLLVELEIEARESLTSLAFSPDGQTLAAGHAGKITLFDFAARRAIVRFDGHDHWVCSLAFSPDGQTLFSGATNNSVMAWDVARQERAGVLYPDMHGTPWDVFALTIAGVGCWLALWIVARRKMRQSQRAWTTQVGYASA